MLIIGLIETALELVPEDIADHPVVVNTAQKRGKQPTKILLDESIHAKAIQTLPDAEKRGRPDVAHRGLLVALDSVLARANQLEIFVHTYSGEIIQIAKNTRLPRRMQRFVGLMEQLLLTKRVPAKGDPLLQIVPETLETYLAKLKPSQTILLSEKGTQISPTNLSKTLVKEAKPLVLIGGFAHGVPNTAIAELVDQQVSLDPDLLPVSTVVGMLVHSMEQVLDLSTRRFQESAI